MTLDTPNHAFFNKNIFFSHRSPGHQIFRKSQKHMKYVKIHKKWACLWFVKIWGRSLTQSAFEECSTYEIFIFGMEFLPRYQNQQILPAVLMLKLILYFSASYIPVHERQPIHCYVWTCIQKWKIDRVSSCWNTKSSQQEG